MEAFLYLMGQTFLKYCPSVQGCLAVKDALLTELDAEKDARIAELKSGKADDESLEWFAERIKPWSPAQRRYASRQLMEGLEPAPINKRGTQLWLIAKMMDYEQRIALLAGLIRFIPEDQVLADFVRALRPVDGKRLAPELAKRLPRGSTRTRSHPPPSSHSHTPG
jgi:hypothetical protein